MMKSTPSLRPSQEQILRYRGGKMGISAVPGSGKTWTLSYLAAQLITSGALNPDQEVLVVTLVNAAVDNFSNRISSQLQAENLLPGYGYRVRTLHGLANDILKERPDLAGLSTNYQILDEAEANRIKHSITRDWLNAHTEFFEPYLEYEEYQKKSVYEGNYGLPRMLESIATAFIRLAKDRELTPEGLKQSLTRTQIIKPLLDMSAEIYTAYQDALTYRGAVDFDDLIRLALRCLKYDPALVNILRARWPYILEDEAQDSNRLQQEILSRLAGDPGNWVRVGDPNQAIYESFTTASPQYLLDFLEEPDVVRQTLEESGRSTLSIINLANHLITWTRKEHPNPHAASALNPPLIEPTAADDPQPNPTNCPECVQLVEREMTPDQEIRYVVSRAQAFIAEHPDQSIVILSPRNTRCFKFVDELRRNQLPYNDSLLRSTSETRLSTGAIANVLNYLEDPKSSRRLAAAYRVWRRSEREDQAKWPFYQSVARIIQKNHALEDYLWPTGMDQWLTSIHEQHQDDAVRHELEAFRKVVHRWHRSVFLPIDQLILTIAQDLFLDHAELALAHKLSAVLRQFSDSHPDWRLPEFTQELANIARNQRRFLGFSQEENAFNPDQYIGQVVVATMHKAKGLEWDNVYLTSVNNYNFPSGQEYDQYQPEKWFVKDRENLEAEIIAQLEALLEDHPFEAYQPGAATQEARQEFIRERLRLLYVGITRARRWLTITWNTGRTHNKNVPARAFLELINTLEGQA